jgi:hypothetical protein
MVSHTPPKSPNRHPRHPIAKPPPSDRKPKPYDRQRRQSKGCCSRSDQKSDRCALVSLSRDAGRLVKRRELPEVRSPILRQAIARVPIMCFWVAVLEVRLICIGLASEEGGLGEFKIKKLLHRSKRQQK